MARVGTTFLNLGMYLLGENPGAGSQVEDSTGLNGNWFKLDVAVGTQHNSDGTHKDAVIDAASLKSTVVDGTTLLQDSSTKKLKVKDKGITATQINDAAITTTQIASATILQSNMANGSIGTAQIIDDNVTTAKLADDAVTPAKQSHDNTARKMYFVFTHKVATNGTFSWFNDTQSSSTLGVPLPRAGSITAMTAKDNSSGASVTNTFAYGVVPFNAGDFLGCMYSTVGSVACLAMINGVGSGALVPPGANLPNFITIEVELDD